MKCMLKRPAPERMEWGRKWEEEEDTDKKKAKRSTAAAITKETRGKPKRQRRKDKGEGRGGEEKKGKERQSREPQGKGKQRQLMQALRTSPRGDACPRREVAENRGIFCPGIGAQTHANPCSRVLSCPGQVSYLCRVLAVLYRTVLEHSFYPFVASPSLLGRPELTAI